MGYIYVIENDVNNKVYVGQTKRAPHERFMQHIKDSIHGDTNKLHTAMREIGVEHFYIGKFREVDDSILTDEEQRSINELNSIVLGYNSVSAITNYQSIIEHKERIKELWEEGCSYTEIAIELGVSQPAAAKAVTELGLNKVKREMPKRKSKGAKPVVMYTLDFEPIGWFSNMKNACIWIRGNTLYRCSEFCFYTYVNVAIANGSIAYGYRWQALNDLEADGMTFRSTFDKAAYLNGGIPYKENGKSYYIVAGALDKIIKQSIKSESIQHKGGAEHRKVRYCKQCGRSMECASVTGLCMSCANVIAKGKCPKPSKEQLEKMLLDGEKVIDIAKKYDRVPSTVIAWKHKYGIM